MRAREFIWEGGRLPIISLRHVNKLKKMKLARQEKYDRHQKLVKIMYGDPTRDEALIDLQKAYTELAQQQAELKLTRARGGR